MKKTFLYTVAVLLSLVFLQPVAAQELPADAVYPDWQSEIPLAVHPVPTVARKDYRLHLILMRTVMTIKYGYGMAVSW